MAKITIFSTKGSQKRELVTNATTWGELKREISSLYDMSNLQATENVNRTDLVSDTAVLPKGDFTLFLRPIKTKSGAYSYEEAKRIIQSNPTLKEDIKRVYGKSYTNLSTEVLNEAISRLLLEDTVTVNSDIKADNSLTEKFSEEEFIDTFYAIASLLNNLAEIVDVKVSLKVSTDWEEEEDEEDYDEEIERLIKEAESIFGDID